MATVLKSHHSPSHNRSPVCITPSFQSDALCRLGGRQISSPNISWLLGVSKLSQVCEGSKCVELLSDFPGWVKVNNFNLNPEARVRSSWKSTPYVHDITSQESLKGFSVGAL